MIFPRYISKTTRALVSRQSVCSLYPLGNTPTLYTTSTAPRGIATRPPLPQPRDLLPHRPPFLFLDSVTAVDVDPRGQGPSYVSGTVNEEGLKTPFLLIEALGQCGAILVKHLDAFRDPKVIPVFASINNAKFPHTVSYDGITPEDIVLRTDLVRMPRARFGLIHATATTDSQVLCEVDLWFGGQVAGSG